MFNLSDESDSKQNVNISIGDLRKMIAESPKEWVIVGICDKLEELEKRIEQLEEKIKEVNGDDYSYIE